MVGLLVDLISPRGVVEHPGKGRLEVPGGSEIASGVVGFRPPALLLVFGLFVGACGAAPADDVATTEFITTTTVTTSSTIPETTTTFPGTTTTRPVTTTVPATTSTSVAGTVIEVTVSNSTVDGGGRVSVPLGEEVMIRVTADSSDEVHVHGYDLLAEVSPGAPGEVTFIADIPGIFEVELESSHLRLVTLVVEA